MDAIIKIVFKPFIDAYKIYLIHRILGLTAESMTHTEQSSLDHLLILTQRIS